MFIGEDVAARVCGALYAGHCGLSSAAVQRRLDWPGPMTIDTRLALLRAQLHTERRHAAVDTRGLAAALLHCDQDEDDDPSDEHQQEHGGANGDDGQGDHRLLAELARREALSVLCVSLHAHGYCLSVRTADGSGGTPSQLLGYEERELLDAIASQQLPVELVDLLDEAGASVFCSGCVVCEVRDYRDVLDQTAAACGCGGGSSGDKFRSTLVLLRPTQCTMLADVRRLAEQHALSPHQRDQLEAELTRATAPPLCLDPSPAVGIVMRLAQRSAAPLGIVRPTWASAGIHGDDVTSSRSLPLPSGPMARLHGFLKHKKRLPPRHASATVAKDNTADWQASPAAKKARLAATTDIVAPDSASDDVRRLARRLPLPTIEAEANRDNSLRLREQNSVEWERAGGRLMHMTLSVLVRPSDESYHGRLYVDRDYQQNPGSGASCQFTLCCRAAAELYVRQCIDIFTEYGKKSAKLTHQTAGQPARVSYTRGARERQEQLLQQQQLQQQQQTMTTTAAASSSLASVHQQQHLQQRLVRAGQQQMRVAVRPHESPASGAPTLTAQLNRPPLATRTAAAVAATAGVTSKPQRVVPVAAPSSGQTIQIKVSGQNNQLAQILQTQLQQSIQMPLATAPQQQRVMVSVSASSLQALLAAPPVTATAGISPQLSHTPSLLEKLVARPPNVVKSGAQSPTAGAVHVRTPTRVRTASPGQAVGMTGTTAVVVTTPPVLSRTELQNPTLTELLNAPVAGTSSGATASDIPTTVSGGVHATPATASTNQDLLKAAMQLVQSGDLINELENLSESLLVTDQSSEEQQRHNVPPRPQTTPVKLERTSPRSVTPQVTTHGRLLIKSEPPPPNINIMNLPSTGAVDSSGVGGNIPQPLQNVQLSIPGLCAPISINVGPPPSLSQAPTVIQPAQSTQLASQQSTAAALTPSTSFQLVRPAAAGTAGAGVVAAASGQRVYAVSSVLAGAQPVIITSVADHHQNPGSRHQRTQQQPQQQVLLSPPGGGQRVLITRPQPQQLVLAPATGAAAQLPMSVVHLAADQLQGLVTTPTGSGGGVGQKSLGVTPQQRAQILQQQHQPAARKPSG